MKVTRVWSCRIMLVLIISAGVGSRAAAQTTNDKPGGTVVSVISVEELKAKFTKNEPVTIIDVRASEGYANSTSRIKGAIHVKLRRLKSRLGVPPFKDIPRDREVVTYCACPSEEASIAAAQVLLSSGFTHVRALKGGWTEWLKIGGQVDSKPKG